MRLLRERREREGEEKHEWLQENGHGLPSKEDSPVLFYWVDYQRCKRAKLSPEQIAKLRDLGVVPFVMSHTPTDKRSRSKSTEMHVHHTQEERKESESEGESAD
jgi:hypothetical protein